MKKILIVCLAALAITGCEEDGCDNNIDTTYVDQTQLAADVAEIDSYLASKGITAVEDVSGIRYVIHEEGTGGRPELCDKVRVAYKGTLLGRTSVFDESDDIEFTLGSLIFGWQIGFSKLSPGSKATLYIPSGLAYGPSSPSGSIPANAILQFEVELFSFR